MSAVAATLPHSGNGSRRIQTIEISPRIDSIRKTIAIKIVVVTTAKVIDLPQIAIQETKILAMKNVHGMMTAIAHAIADSPTA